MSVLTSPGRRWPLALCLLLLLPFLGLGTPPLFDLDEGAFTASTTEMFLRHDFLSSYLLGEPRYDKPVLVYWLQALSVQAFGFNEWGFRLPSALAASAWIALTYAFVRRVMTPGSDARALVAALVLATVVGPGIIQRAATADALLNLWLAAAGYAGWLWLREDKPLWRDLGFAAMALGFLTKGPVAVVVPAGALFLWCASTGQWARYWRWALNPRSLAIFSAIAAPWFVVQSVIEGPGFILDFFFRHNLGRYSAPMEGHGGNALYYLPVVLISLLPHTGLLLGALRRPLALWREPLSRYGLLWFLLVLGLFSASGTKLPHYVYYGYGGLLLVMVPALDPPQARRWMLWPAVLLFALLLALPLLVTGRLPQFRPDDQLLLSDLGRFFDLRYRLGVGCALAVSLGTLLWPRPGLRTALMLNGVLAALVMTLLVAPALGEVQQGPIRTAGRLAAARAEPLVMYKITTPSLQTYAHRSVVRRDPVAGDLVFTRASRLRDLPGANVIYRERGYLLALMP